MVVFVSIQKHGTGVAIKKHTEFYHDHVMSHKQFGQCLDSWKKRKEELLTQIAIELKCFKLPRKKRPQ